MSLAVTTTPEPTERFTARVSDYARFRPGYPKELIAALCEQCELAPGAKLAQLGSGTGISTRLLLDRGLCVFAVEPNDAMRAAAESTLAATNAFTSLCGTAEATGLPSATMDVVTAAQAFHGFDVPRALPLRVQALRRTNLLTHRGIDPHRSARVGECPRSPAARLELDAHVQTPEHRHG